MRKKNTPKKIAILALAVLLLTLSGVGSYFASGYLSQRRHAEIGNESQVAQTKPQEAAPDHAACIAALPSDVKFAQKLMLAVYSDQIAAAIPVASELGVGGVIIMDEISAEHIKQLRDSFEIAPFIAVDQEGGTVQRYKSQGILPGADSMPDIGTDTAYDLYLKDSQFLASIGITTNFAPVVDIRSLVPSPLPGRMYSDSPDTVVRYATQAIKAMKAAHIQPVIKHFPGLGSSSGNTDFVSASTDPFSTIESRDLIPYVELADMQVDVMVGNMVVPGLTNGQPAIWSKEAVALLRQKGYEDAVVYSDSLTAKAVPGTIEDAAIKAWEAGIDVAVIVQERQDLAATTSYVQSIISLGTAQLTSDATKETVLNDSIGRILKRKSIDPCLISP